MHNKKTFSMIIFTVFISVILFNFIGCDRKAEPPKEEKPAEVVKEDTIPVEIPKDTIPDITGVWKGKFDKRDFTLTITSQEKNSFKGKTVIKYREQISQEVSGTFDKENLIITMKDLLHGRFAGTYNGKISDDWGSIAGKFTVTVDGNKYDFNLKR